MPYVISSRRFWLTNFFLFSSFLIIFYQLIQLTIIRRPALENMASKQHKLVVDIPPLRGQILDRKGRELAANLKVPSIYAIPRLIRKEERKDLAKKISRLLNLEEKFLIDRLSRDKSFIWIKRKVTAQEAEKITNLAHSGFGILEEYKRFYPQGDLLAQILGFTDIDNAGLEGIELYLNRDLQGRPGRRYTKRDALGREIKAFEVKTIPALDGHQVSLTIDQYVQYLTERALDRAFTNWKAVGGWAVVMEAKTGKIIAIANRPTFNPNSYEKSRPDSRRNRSLTDMYEPGSVFKIVAASAALNEHKVTPDTIFNCENGSYQYGSKVLHDVHPYGMLSFADVIVKSSNIGTVKIASKLDPKVFQSYIDAFGFGKLTGIDLPGEVPGYTRPPALWSKTSPYNIPMGQEILVTTLQMTAAMAVIANGGNLVTPYMIEKIQDKAGVTLRERKPIIKHRVIRPDTAQTMRQILVRVVEEGTGKKAKIEGIPVGGKTGTAQKVLPGGRGYSHSNFVSSFIGFAPAEDPQLVMTVVLDDPKPLYYGGTVAAPVFKEVMEAALYSQGYVPGNAKTLEEFNGAGAFAKNPPAFEPAETVGKAVPIPGSRPVT
ncbi:MAG: penicillin-binding protein 2 [Candidatus Omnitrophica bacterium]|nr:penicillin-binding protein 2 [Candidatus Omnitrophota bacterium]